MGQDLSCSISALSRADVNGQLQSSKQDLQRHGLHSPTFTLPCGLGLYANNHLESLVRNYYQASIELHPQINHLKYHQAHMTYAFSVSNATSMKELSNWLEKTKEENGWIILMFNRVENSANPKSSAISKAKLKHILVMIKKINLQVVIPAQIPSFHA